MEARDQDWSNTHTAHWEYKLTKQNKNKRKWKHIKF